MRSLNDHLLAGDDHGRLPFHPDCPVCVSTRRGGGNGSDAMTALRTQAAVAAGVVVFSAVAPGASLATEPDDSREGTAVPQEGPAGDTAVNPDFDPGGDETVLPVDLPDSPPAGAGPPGVPVPADPVVDDGAESSGSATTGGAQPEPAAEETTTDTPAPADPADEAPAAPPSEATPAPAPQVPSATPVADTAEDAGSPGESEPVVRESGAVQVPGDEHRAGRTAEPAPVPSAAGTSTQPAAGTASASAESDREVSTSTVPASSTADGDRFHVVRAGESLWSIAKRFVGEDASPARVAHEVNRLWALNEDRIATGDPNMLPVGTRLVLP